MAAEVVPRTVASLEISVGVGPVELVLAADANVEVEQNWRRAFGPKESTFLESEGPGFPTHCWMRINYMNVRIGSGLPKGTDPT
jgi:hypothetical protein